MGPKDENAFYLTFPGSATIQVEVCKDKVDEESDSEPGTYTFTFSEYDEVVQIKATEKIEDEVIEKEAKVEYKVETEEKDEKKIEDEVTENEAKVEYEVETEEKDEKKIEDEVTENEAKVEL